MDIRIETYADYEYESIAQEYGEVLYEFNLHQIIVSSRNNMVYNGAAITINALDDLFLLDKKLREFDEKIEEWHVYFGILTQEDHNGTYLCIKDSYD